MIAGIVGVLALIAQARAGDAAEVHRCLAVYDLACATRASAGLGRSADELAARSELDFSLGNFAAARDELKTAGRTPEGTEDYPATLDLYEKTVAASADFTTETRGDVTLRYRPGMDAVLVDEAFETLQAAHDRIGSVLGGAPPGGVRMELYPTAQRFIDASSLPGDAVRTTGVIALSKWTRLLVSSPRALGRGYAWKDTISHEYTHYIVAWRTRDQAPVWLQEGIARSHESLWHADQPAPLTPEAAGLLADALANDKLVPLQKMHPSMAFLSSSEEASLAFAQVSTMIEYLRSVQGPDAVSRVLDLVRDGRDALQAVADVGSEGDVDAFMAGWKGYLRSLKLVGKKLATAKVVLDGGGDEYANDPVLADRADLARFARLGDLLMEKKRADAALVEFRKAAAPDEPPSPLLATRTAGALVALGRKAEARTLLEGSVTDYPEYASTHAALGKLALGLGDSAAAFVQYRASVDIDPFDPITQAALGDLYATRGDAALAERHHHYARVLQSAEPATR